MKPEVRWPLLIVGLLASQILLGGFFLWKATSDPSFAIEQDYYQKAIAWDKKMAQDQRNAELGWTVGVRVRMAEQPGKPASLEVTLSDAAGEAVTGANVSVETFHNVRAGTILKSDLPEQRPGIYSAQLNMKRPGIWEVRLTATAGTSTYTHVERVLVTPGRP